MSLILGLDFETTGLDPIKDRVIEVGLALWDTAIRRAIRMADFLVQPEIEVPQSAWDELRPIHGISKEDVDHYGISQFEAFKIMREFEDPCDAIVAHNGTMFDQKFYEEWLLRNAPCANRKLWIDTRLDLPEPMVGSLVCQAAQKGFLRSAIEAVAEGDQRNRL